MGDILSFRDDPHLSTEMLLPWYASGQLDEEDRAAVEAHLGTCGQCRAALEQERQLKAEIRQLPLQADLDWREPQRRRETPRFRPWAMMTRPAALAAFACAQALLLAGAVLLFRPAPSPPDYHVLGSPAARTGGNLIVIFRPDTSEESLRLTLDHAGARLVDGPTAAGAYVLAVDPARRDAVLAALRTRPNIVLAQPIEPDAAP